MAGHDKTQPKEHQLILDPSTHRIMVKENHIISYEIMISSSLNQGAPILTAWQNDSVFELEIEQFLRPPDRFQSWIWNGNILFRPNMHSGPAAEGLEDTEGPLLVDCPTQLICSSDIYLSTDKNKKDIAG